MEESKNKNSRIVISLVALIIVFILGFSFGKASNSSSEASIFSIFSRLFGGKAVTAGDVSVQALDTPSDAAIILGGTEARVGAYMFTAANDAMSVKKMQVLISPLNNPNNPNENAADEVPFIRLYDGATMLTGGSSSCVVNGVAYTGCYAVTPSGENAGIAFINNLNWVIPKNAAKNLIVKGLVSTVGYNGLGSDTGASIYSHVRSQGFEACSMSNSSSCDTLINPASSAQRLVYKSKPILEKIAYNGLLQAGNKIPAFKFKVSADPMGHIELGKVQFYIAMHGATMTAVNSQTAGLYDLTNGTYIYLDRMFSSPTIPENYQQLPISDTGYVTFVLAVPQRIQAGSLKEYELRLGFRDLIQSPEAQAIIELNSGDIEVNNAKSFWQIEAPRYDGEPSFIWSDYSAFSHTTSTLDWANGIYVKVFGDANVIHN